MGVINWELGIKVRGLSGNGRTKETKLHYKSVAPLFFDIGCLSWFLVVLDV